jgi:GNAT superfamily N-acetyltransferase
MKIVKEDAMTVELTIRLSTLEEVPSLNQLIKQSARELSRGFYTEIETDAAIEYVFGVDTTLVKDGNYFTATLNGELAGCGGWSRRRTMYGGDQRPVGESEFLDRNQDAARIRAFFIAPQAARKGVGKAIFEACQAAAKADGFQRLELMATLPGVPFYAAIGFQKVEDVVDVLPNGVPLAFVLMQKHI